MSNRSRTFLQKLRSACYLSIGGGIAYTAMSLYNNNEKFYRDVLMPSILLLDPETSHNLALKALKYGLIPKNTTLDSSVLKTKFLGKELKNPIGIAAGFDKNGDAINGLQKLGFSCIEIGSITPRAQEGNSKPRVFRLPEDMAVINRYGFNSDGHDAVLERINKVSLPNDTILGINLGKNKLSTELVEDYLTGVQKFSNKADYLVINISSPNTPGLRSLQTKDNLYVLLSNIIETRNSIPDERKTPFFLKLSPDLSSEEKKDIINVLKKKDCKVDGLIICNTTTQRINISNKEVAEESGGLSGKPLKDMSTEFIREMYKQTGGKIPIIGVGGISNGHDAFEKILAGATIVQIYTAFIYNGPPIISRIKAELSDLLVSNGFHNVNDAVGKEDILKKR